MKFEDMINKIHYANCLELMKDVPDNSIDLVVTSPPYDNLRDYKGYSFDFKSIAKELFRVMKKGGVVVWVVGDATINGSETGTSFRQALFFKEIGFNLHDTMIYEKGGIPYPSSNRYNQISEYMFVFSKGKPKTYNLIKDRKNLWKGHKAHWGKPRWRQKDGEMKEIEDNHIIPEFSVRTNIWRYKIGKGNSTKDEFVFKHPAIFPEKLAQDHIISWSNENDIVLDPMVGSGTTCKMAKLLNRKFIGIDISQEYVELAWRRINDVPKRLDKFF